MAKTPKTKEVKDDVLQLYGDVAIPRIKCPKCNDRVFVVEGVTTCHCAVVIKITDYNFSFARMSKLRRDRKAPEPHERTRLLRMFNYKCAYCAHKLWEHFDYRGKIRYLDLVWDLGVPSSIAGLDPRIEFLPCCSVCFELKKGKVFHTLEEIQDYVQKCWNSL